MGRDGSYGLKGWNWCAYGSLNLDMEFEENKANQYHIWVLSSNTTQIILFIILWFTWI